jgi:hypothetical protein
MLARYALMLFGSGVLAAQQAPCTFDQCALRVQYGFLATRIVGGVNGEKVAGLGLFAPHVPMLEAGPDSARVHYRSFQNHYNSGAVFKLIGAAAIVGSFSPGGGYNAYSADNKNTALGLLLVGFTSTLIGYLQSRHGTDELERSIWFYNRDLPAAR